MMEKHHCLGNILQDQYLFALPQTSCTQIDINNKNKARIV